MITYKNTSRVVKTFYGIQFNPGDTHDVPGYITDPAMIRASSTSKPVSEVKDSMKSPDKSEHPTKKGVQKQPNVTNKSESKEENPNGKHND